MERHNKERQVYVSAEIIERIIAEQAPSSEWRLLLAMARYLGVRVPSEPFSITWDCIDWEKSRLRIPNPKTEVHGKSFRVVPILPQVRPHLEAVFNEAPEGSVYIFHRLRERDSMKHAEKGFWANCNLRKEFTKMLTRAGIHPWPRLWHNLRSSAQTDLANKLPAHVVCEWLGNTQAVAQQHYLQVTETHFEIALGGSKSDVKSDVKPTQHRDSGSCIGDNSNGATAYLERSYASQSESVQNHSKLRDGAEEIRTLDLRIANASLSQLSYCP